MALKDAATWRDRRDGVDVHVVGHDLNEVAGKEVILGHKVLSVGTAVGLQLSESLDARNRYCMSHVGILVDINAFCIKVSTACRISVGRAEMVLFLKALKRDVPIHCALQCPRAV